MDHALIFQPMGALVALTFLVLLVVPFRRFQSAFRGEVNRDDFKFGESARVPGQVSIPNRNLMNLLEMPVLFYVACLTLFVTQQVSQLQLTLAWAYVILRAGHSLVHLTFNNVLVRLSLFALSNFVLIAIWALFLSDHYAPGRIG
jgi:hypothetical protein